MRLRASTLLFVSIVSGIACSSSSGGDANAPPPSTSAAGAGGSNGGGGASGGGGATSSGPIEVRFVLPASGVPGFLDVPFPSDVYRDADGTLVDTIPGFADGQRPFVGSNGSYLLDALGKMNGFGVTGGAIFRVQDPSNVVDGIAHAVVVDPASLPADEASCGADGASAFLIDLEATDASAARVPCRAAPFVPTKASYTDAAVVVQPARGVVLKEGHRYAAVLATGMKTKSGADVAASDAFAKLRDVARSSDAEKAYGDAIDTVTKLVPSLAGKIVAIAPYTTFTLEHELFDMRAQAMTATPSLSWSAADLAPMGVGLFASGDAASLPSGFTATLDAWLGKPDQLSDGHDDPAADQPNGYGHDALAAVGTAVYESPYFLVESPMGFDDPSHHTVAHDASGKVVPSPGHETTKVWMTIALPKTPMPPSGYPVVLVQHGLGGDRAAILEVANTFAERGWATAAIDAITHGARAPNAASTKDQVAFATRRGAKDGSSKWGPPGLYDGPDGLPDVPNGPTDFFATLLSMGALRDHFRQNAIDLTVAFDVLASPSLDLGPLLAKVPGAKLDATKMAYLGNSLGGILGSLTASIEDRATTFVLNVPGGGVITEVATHSPVISSYLGTAVTLNFSFRNDAPVDPFHPAAQLVQHLIDAGDPLLYARRIVTEPATIGAAKNPPKNVLQVEVLWDELVSNEGNEALARAAGFGLGEPSTGTMTGMTLPTVSPTNGALADFPAPGGIAVMIQASPATHGNDMSARTGDRTYAHPYGQFDTDKPFPALPHPITIHEPYLAMQTTFADFIASAFAGSPKVQGFPTPVRDFDGDGVPDDQDAAPEDPTMH